MWFTIWTVWYDKIHHFDVFSTILVPGDPVCPGQNHDCDFIKKSDWLFRGLGTRKDCLFMEDQNTGLVYEKKKQKIKNKLNVIVGKLNTSNRRSED